MSSLGGKTLLGGLTVRLFASLVVIVLALLITVLQAHAWLLQRVTSQSGRAAAAFVSARLLETDRDWALQTEDWRISIENAKLLDTPDKAKIRLDAFFTIHLTVRHFEHLLIQTAQGGKLYEYGKNLAIPGIDWTPAKSSDFYTDPASGAVLRVHSQSLWLGNGRPKGLLLIFYRIDTDLLDRMAPPDSDVQFIAAGTAVTASRGWPADRESTLVPVSDPTLSKSDLALNKIDWPENRGGRKDIGLVLRTRTVPLVSGPELALGAVLIPVLDLTLIWMLLGAWALTQSRRISILTSALSSFNISRTLTSSWNRKIVSLREGRQDEIAEAASALCTLAENVVVAESFLQSEKLSLTEQIRDKTTALEVALLSARRLKMMADRLFDSVPEPLLLLNSNRIVVRTNEAAERAFASGAAQIHGRSVNMFVSALGQDPQDELRLADVLLHGQSKVFARRLDGSLFPADVYQKVVLLDDAPHTIVAVIDATQREKALADAASSGERYRTMYAETPVMLHSIDGQGLLIDVSNTWLKMLGYERSEVIGRRSSDFLTEESRLDALNVVLPAFYANGRCDDIPYTMVKKNGELMDVRLSAVAERDVNRTIGRSLAVLQDVTELNRSQRALLDSEARFRGLFTNLHSGLLLLDALVNSDGNFVDGRIAALNPALCDMLELRPQEVIGQLLTISIPSDEIQRDDRFGKYSEVLETGTPIRFQVHSKMRNRSFDILAYRPAHGQLALLLNDITDQVSAERTREATEHRYERLIDAIHDYSIIMLNPEGCVASWNAGAERATGYGVEQVLGRHYKFLFCDDAEAEKHLAQACLSGRSTAEGWRRREDGSRFWVTSTLDAIRDSEGQLQGYAKVTRDLTERMRESALFQRVTEMAPNSLLLLDQAGHIQFANRQTTKMFGYSQEEIVGAQIDILISPTSLGPIKQIISQQSTSSGVIQSPLTAPADTVGLRKNGSEVAIQVSVGGMDEFDVTPIVVSIVDIEAERSQREFAHKSLTEKETLLKEVYHRVKNNLQVVQSLLRMQHRALPAGSAKEALVASEQRLRAMALVHELLYRSADLAVVNMSEYLPKLVGQIADALGASERGINLACAICDANIGLDTAIPLGLLVNELLGNSLKHAFPDSRSGTVLLEAIRCDDRIGLSIKDDGVGLPADLDLAHAKSMGLMLASSLARQLGGELKLSALHGTEFSTFIKMD